MKTLAFYSYKGGTGKSLMATNLAVCLSRLGRDCALVDCDVDGPTLHHKLGESGTAATGRGGLASYVKRFLGGCRRDESLYEAGKLRRRGDGSELLRFGADATATPFSYPIDDAWSPKQEPGDDERRVGTVHFLPAGDVYSRAYWETVGSRPWFDLFRAYDLREQRLIDDDTYRSVAGALQQVKLGIQNLDPAPEYLILDLPAGPKAVASTLIHAWVDTLVYSFSFNDDGIDYLRNTFGDFWSAGHKRERGGNQAIPTRQETDFRIELALCRVPRQIEFTGDRRLWEALGAIGATEDNLCPVHSDPDLELREEIRCGLRRQPQPRRVTHDYTGLFERLIEPRQETGSIAAGRAGWLAKAIGLRDADERVRQFRWETKVGALINPNDGSRNVAFKVATFQKLLQGLKEEIGGWTESRKGKAGDSRPNQEQERLDGFLRAAGRSCGTSFGEALAQEWRVDETAVSAQHYIPPAERVRRWCHFDSDIGFGRFSENAGTMHVLGPTLIECEISLVESFLTPAWDTEFQDFSDHTYCSFMTGYISGVLENILRQDLTVTHENGEGAGDSEDLGPRSESCRFVVRGAGTNVALESSDGPR